MELGEKIYKLRTEKNLSQGDLADKLEVSRQSISKWENNSAIPDLEKIVRLSEIFGVSLDELVKGEQRSTVSYSNIPPRVTPIPPTPVYVQQSPKKNFPTRKIVGIVLFVIAFLLAMIITIANVFIGRYITGVVVGLFAGIIFTSPLWLSGIICFVFKRYVGLYCGWGIYLLIDIYLRLATGISWNNVFIGYYYYTERIITVRTIVAWIELFVMLFLIFITLFLYRKEPLQKTRKNRNKIVAAWIVFTVAIVISIVFPYTGLYSLILANILSLSTIYTVCNTIMDWCKIISLTYALTNTIRYIKQH